MKVFFWMFGQYVQLESEEHAHHVYGCLNKQIGMGPPRRLIIGNDVFFA